MNYKTLATITACLGTACAVPAIAQTCDASYTFDGNLTDASGNGYDGQMIGKDGASAAPQFVPGRSGQALALDGTSAMRAFVDLHYDTCPQVTVAAWVRVDAFDVRGTQYLLSTGSGHGPGLSKSSTNLTLSGTANGLRQGNAIRDNAGWMFVAGVYDYTNNTYTLYARNRSVTGEISANRRPPEEALWVGAFNDGLAGAATGVVIDELRIYGKLLSEDELRALQTAATPAVAAAQTSAPGGMSCSVHADCGTGNYCAFDNTCHPESHAPKRDLTFAVVDAPIPSGGLILSEGTGTGSTGSGTGLSPEIPGAAAGFETALPMSGDRTGISTDALAARDAETRLPVIGYASEEEAIAAAEAAAERRALEAASAEPEPAPLPSGPYATGNAAFTALAGWTGGTQQRIDLGAEFLTRIAIEKEGNYGCRIQANEQVLDLCRGYSGAASEISVALNGSVIGRLDVCGLGTVQGLRVWGDVVDADGSTRYEPAAASREFPECRMFPSLQTDPWTSSVLCPNGTVGSGIVVHSTNTGAPADIIVGLQLICRRVAVR